MNLESQNRDDCHYAVAIMQSLNISMELFKENFMDLLPEDNRKRFEQIPTATKTAFTRAYNLAH